MLIAVLILVSAAAAGVAFAAFRSVFRTPWGRAPAAAAAETIEEHIGVRRFVANRLDAEVVTGLALTAALVVIVAAGLLVAGLAVAVRHLEGLSDVDSAAALWANRHGGALQHRLLEAVSTLASTGGVVVIAVAVCGWLLDFGAPVERAARPGPVPVSRPGGRPRAGASGAAAARPPDRPARHGRS